MSYKLQRCQVKDRDIPYWRTARFEDVTNVIQYYPADMSRPIEPVKRIWYTYDIIVCAFGSQDSKIRAQEQQLSDRDVLFPTR